MIWHTWHDWKICFGMAHEFRNKDNIARRCLRVANEARFPTDFHDVYAHLFDNEDYIICMALNRIDQLDGFSVFSNLSEIKTLHLHGIVLHPRAQGKGLGSEMIKTIVDNNNQTFLTAKTHNPRMFETLSKFACDDKSFYPNSNNADIPSEIYELVKKNEFISMVDKYLIVRYAYPDEKLSQTYRNEMTFKIFKNLYETDAQVIVIKLK